MANSYTTNLNLTKPEVGADNDQWGTHQNAAFDAIDGVFNSDGSGTSVGLNVGSGKTFSLGGTLTAIASSIANLFLATVSVAASRFSIKDATDSTKVVQLNVSGLTTGSTRTLSVPDASGSVVLDTATQTLTNKTLTSPTISGATMTTPALGTPASGTLTNCTGLPAANLSGSVAFSQLASDAANAKGARTVSTSAPSGGADGDIWYQV